MKRHLHLFLMLAGAFQLHAQSADPLSGKPAIRMIANPRNNAITLRWAPTTPDAWETANQYGYSLQRVTLLRGNRRAASLARSSLRSSNALTRATLLAGAAAVGRDWSGSRRAQPSCSRSTSRYPEDVTRRMPQA
jgi:hypothetical protein